MSKFKVMMGETHDDHEYYEDPLLKESAEDDEIDETESSDAVGDDDYGHIGSEKITKPGEHDVLLGRGGGTNNHHGNVKFRKLVNEHKMRYLACSKVEKPKVAREVVQLWRKLDPPGRFLAREDETKKGPGSVKAADNVWYEVGDKKAREKASQCLRERTPDVIPYIKHLRDQQNAITEHGVSMVQQQLLMQEQAQQRGVPFQPTFPPSANSKVVPSPAFPRRNSMPIPPQQPMVSPVRNGSAAVPPANVRRVSLPAMQQGVGIPQVGPLTPNGRRSGLPVLSQQQMMMAQQQQMGFMYDLPDEEFYGTGEMSDIEFQHNMMMMQQQMQQMQQIHQVRRMQQQQRLQQQQRIQQQMQRGPAAAMDLMAAQNFGNMMPPQRRGVAKSRSGNGNSIMMDAFLDQMNAGTGGGILRPGGKPVDNVGSLSQRPLKDANANKRAGPAGTNATPKSAMAQPKRKLVQDKTPDKAVSAGAEPLSYIQPVDHNADENELSLEEYRQQLEEYISNSMGQNNGNVVGLDENDLHLKADDDDSDLEDDWEKEKEKAYRQMKERNSEKQRGMNRNASGVSAMSLLTKGSTAMSMVSGLSGLSDMMSTNSDQVKQQREAKMSMNRSMSSNLSLMSELTDLSHNIDNLSLYDDGEQD